MKLAGYILFYPVQVTLIVPLSILGALPFTVIGSVIAAVARGFGFARYRVIAAIDFANEVFIGALSGLCLFISYLVFHRWFGVDKRTIFWMSLVWVGVHFWMWVHERTRTPRDQFEAAEWFIKGRPKKLTLPAIIMQGISLIWLFNIFTN